MIYSITVSALASTYFPVPPPLTAQSRGLCAPADARTTNFSTSMSGFLSIASLCFPESIVQACTSICIIELGIWPDKPWAVIVWGQLLSYCYRLCLRLCLNFDTLSLMILLLIFSQSYQHVETTAFALLCSFLMSWVYSNGKWEKICTIYASQSQKVYIWWSF